MGTEQKPTVLALPDATSVLYLISHTHIHTADIHINKQALTQHTRQFTDMLISTSSFSALSSVSK
jgi:hypothetical protein